MIPDRCGRQKNTHQKRRVRNQNRKPRKRESCVDQVLTRLVRKSGGSKRAAKAGSRPRGSRSSGVRERVNHTKKTRKTERDTNEVTKESEQKIKNRKIEKSKNRSRKSNHRPRKRKKSEGSTHEDLCKNNDFYRYGNGKNTGTK